MYHIAPLATFIMLIATSATAQNTLPELASRGVNPVERGVFRDVVAPSLEDLSTGADVIVDARLIRAASYLSKNKMEVNTDYVIQPTRTLASGGSVPRQTPGITRMILTLRHGKIEVNGITVQFDDDNLAPFNSGDRFLLFLKRSGAGSSGEDRFVPFGDIAGLVRIEAGRTRSMIRSKGDPRDIEGLDVDGVIGRVLVARGRK